MVYKAKRACGGQTRMYSSFKVMMQKYSKNFVNSDVKKIVVPNKIFRYSNNYVNLYFPSLLGEKLDNTTKSIKCCLYLIMTQNM